MGLCVARSVGHDGGRRHRRSGRAQGELSGAAATARVARGRGRRSDAAQNAVRTSLLGIQSPCFARVLWDLVALPSNEESTCTLESHHTTPTIITVGGLSRYCSGINPHSHSPQELNPAAPVKKTLPAFATKQPSSSCAEVRAKKAHGQRARILR